MQGKVGFKDTASHSQLYKLSCKKILEFFQLLFKIIKQGQVR